MRSFWHQTEIIWPCSYREIELHTNEKIVPFGSVRSLHDNKFVTFVYSHLYGVRFLCNYMAKLSRFGVKMIALMKLRRCAHHICQKSIHCRENRGTIYGKMRVCHFTSGSWPMELPNWDLKKRYVYVKRLVESDSAIKIAWSHII
jgi:hypothetical protein